MMARKIFPILFIINFSLGKLENYKGSFGRFFRQRQTPNRGLNFMKIYVRLEKKNEKIKAKKKNASELKTAAAVKTKPKDWIK